jgi:hypothetical protein
MNRPFIGTSISMADQTRKLTFLKAGPEKDRS